MTNGDAVNHPSHYEGQTSIECIDVISAILSDYGCFKFCLGNVIKYIWRYKNKNKPEEDIAKAKKYLDFATELLDLNQNVALFNNENAKEEYFRVNDLYMRTCHKGGYDD